MITHSICLFCLWHFYVVITWKMSNKLQGFFLRGRILNSASAHECAQMKCSHTDDFIKIHNCAKNLLWKFMRWSIYVPHQRWGDILVYLRNPGVGVAVSIHHISWITGWNFTILAWIYFWVKPKGWLSFCNFDPIFKVTGGLRLLILLR